MIQGGWRYQLSSSHSRHPFIHGIPSHSFPVRRKYSMAVITASLSAVVYFRQMTDWPSEHSISIPVPHLPRPVPRHSREFPAAKGMRPEILWGTGQGRCCFNIPVPHLPRPVPRHSKLFSLHPSCHACLAASWLARISPRVLGVYPI